MGKMINMRSFPINPKRLRLGSTRYKLSAVRYNLSLCLIIITLLRAMNVPELLSGALVGLLVGLTGVGGGSLMTPLLVLVFGVHPMGAVGTDLWFAAGTKLVASRFYHTQGTIDWEILKRLWLGSLSASLLTLGIVSYFGKSPHVSSMITAAVAVAVLLSAVAMLLKAKRMVVASDDTRLLEPVKSNLTIFIGVILGVIVTLTSVGAGAVGAVMLSALYPQRLSPARLVATDVVHAVPLALIAGMGHLLMGNVDFRLLGTLLIGSIPTVIIGAVLSTRLAAHWVRRLLAAILLIVGAKMLGSVI